MTTVSNIPTSNAYGYNAPVASASSSVSRKPSQAAVPPNAAGLESTLASLGGNSSSLPLTYNAAGLINSFQQATPSNSTAAMTRAQQAQAAVFAAEAAVTETLNSMFKTDSSSDSSSSSGSDISSLLALPGTSNTTDMFGLLQGAPGSSTPQTAQEAMLAAENVITNTLNSLGAGSLSNSSTQK